jgi:crotonobetaine/carnitine-CoA ligase
VDLPDGIEQEIKVWVVPQAGTSLSAEVVFLLCAENMPYFMIPRFIESTDELPKTHRRADHSVVRQHDYARC